MVGTKKIKISKNKKKIEDEKNKKFIRKNKERIFFPYSYPPILSVGSPNKTHCVIVFGCPAERSVISKVSI